jgi:hypothetical protein
MTDVILETVSVDPKQKEDALIGYQVAISLWTYEGAQNWARYNVMLFANSVIIATLGIAINSVLTNISNEPKLSHSFALVSAALSLGGIVLCVLWYLINKRGFDYQNYYVGSARELEELYLAKTVMVVSRGGSFGNGDPVNLEIGGRPKTYRMSWASGVLSAGRVANFVIVLFSIVYGLALIFLLPY